MIVSSEPPDVYHSVSEDFSVLIRAALAGQSTFVGLGPIYGEDPASSILAPLIRSAREAGLDPDKMSPTELFSDSAIRRATASRTSAVVSWSNEALEHDWTDVCHWTRAGLVLEVSRRRGVPTKTGRKHVRWKMRGTVTGRFGVEPGGKFNPLVIPKDERSNVCPGKGRSVAVIDFKAMDLASMISLAPGLKERYMGAEDLHQRTADILGIDRDHAKREVFVHAYGGNSSYKREFERHLPELRYIRGTTFEEAGANARLVQKTSATAFKAGLARALPLLVEEAVCPMFTVHDELALDILSGHEADAAEVAKALSDGASERIGVPYTTGMTIGSDYSEAKR